MIQYVMTMNDKHEIHVCFSVCEHDAGDLSQHTKHTCVEFKCTYNHVYIYVYTHVNVSDV